MGVCLPPIPLPRTLGSVLDLFTLRFHGGDVLILGKALVASPRIVLASVPWFRRQCKKKRGKVALDRQVRMYNRNCYVFSEQGTPKL